MDTEETRGAVGFWGNGNGMGKTLGGDACGMDGVPVLNTRTGKVAVRNEVGEEARRGTTAACGVSVGVIIVFPPVKDHGMGKGVVVGVLLCHTDRLVHCEHVTAVEDGCQGEQRCR